jgi:hypothetical protein
MSDNKIENLSDSSWVRVFVPGFKVHFCPADMANDLKADLVDRMSDQSVRESDVEVESSLSCLIDLPGMIMMDRPVEKFAIDDFTLEVPSQDFWYVMGELDRAAPLRTFASGREYHKIHGWMVCVVMTPDQRADLLKRMEKQLPDIQQRAAEADEEFSLRLKQINKDTVRVVSWRDKANQKKPEDLN